MDHDRARLTARRDELRRVIYGVPGGDTSDAVAQLAAVERELERFERPTSAAAGAIVSSRSTRSRRRRHLMLAGAGLLGAVAVVAVVFSALPDAADTPRGLEVFDRARDDVDAGPRAFVAVLGTDAVETFRSIGHAVGHDVWVFRDDGDVCMIAQRQQWSSWGANCVSEREFADAGIRQFITHDEFGDQAPPAGLDPASAVELAWNAHSTAVEWAIVPRSQASTDGVWVWVPTPVDDGPAPMTYDEWSSSGLAARRVE